MWYSSIFFCQHLLLQNTPQLLPVRCLRREKLLFHRRMNAWYYSRDLFRNSSVENLQSFLTNSMRELIWLSKKKIEMQIIKNKTKTKAIKVIKPS